MIMRRTFAGSSFHGRARSKSMLVRELLDHVAEVPVGAAEEVARLVDEGAVEERPVRIRDQLLGIALEPRAESVARLAGAHVAVEREHPRRERLVEEEPASGMARVLSVPDPLSADRLEREHSVGRRVRLRDRVEQARAGLLRELHAVDDQEDLLGLGRRRFATSDRRL